MRAGALWRVSVDVADAEGAQAALAALDGMCGAVSAFEQPPGGWRVEGLALAPPERGAIEARLALVWSGRGEAPAIAFERLPARDWLGENQESFAPFRVGRFFVHGGNFTGHAPGGTIPLLNLVVGVEVAAGFVILASEFLDQTAVIRTRRR